MPWLRHLALFVVFVTALSRPAAAGAFVSAAHAGSQPRLGLFEFVAGTLAGPSSGATGGLHEGIGAAYDEKGSGYRFAAGSVRSVDDLSSSCGRGGSRRSHGRRTRTAEAGGRPGSAFPAARGAPRQINEAGQHIVDDILTSPGTTTTMRHHARFGDVTEIRAPDGRGVRYNSSGGFIGLLEP
jgi:hypothetical protein